MLGVAAAVEAVTGLLLLALPHLMAKLLFGTEVIGAGIVVGRVAGIALFSLGVGCWLGRQQPSDGWALVSMLTYNASRSSFCLSRIKISCADSSGLGHERTVRETSGTSVLHNLSRHWLEERPPCAPERTNQTLLRKSGATNGHWGSSAGCGKFLCQRC
jgi:hypothetical protein